MSLRDRYLRHVPPSGVSPAICGIRECAERMYRKDHEARVALCDECQSYMEVCPTQLDIPAKLKEAAVILGSR